MRAVLSPILSRLIRIGQLTVHWPDDAVTIHGGTRGPAAAMRLQTTATVRRLVTNPALAIGEAYMDGTLVPVSCDIRDLLELLIINLAGGARHPGQTLQGHARRMMRRVLPSNTAHRARRNAAHHYDLDHRLYRLFLDEDLQYSCAYFADGARTLDEAQAAKKRLIAAKLRLDRPGLRVLDIGCGWGGLALTLARDHGAHVTGVTLSTEQLAIATARAEEEGLSERVTFALQDYRSLDGQYDRIVSVGMFEHVGPAHYDEFFKTVQSRLAPSGIALLHSIGNSGPPSTTNPWLTKYIFPGGYSPSLSEVLPPLERSGLIATDIEILGLHYAETLLHWQTRFARNRAQIAQLYDERFCRMFEFYLAGCEFAFRYQGEIVFQIQLARQFEAAPTSRAYMLEPQRELATALM